MSKDTVLNEFINNTDIKFTDVSGKKTLEYHFPNGSHVTIQKPIYLAILPTGENLIYDSSKTCYKIRPKIGWWKSWKVYDGHPHFTEIDVVSVGNQKELELITS